MLRRTPCGVDASALIDGVQTGFLHQYWLASRHMISWAKQLYDQYYHGFLPFRCRMAIRNTHSCPATEFENICAAIIVIFPSRTSFPAPPHTAVRHASFPHSPSLKCFIVLYSASMQSIAWKVDRSRKRVFSYKRIRKRIARVRIGT